MGKITRHVEKIIDKGTIVRELSKSDDVEVKSSSDGKVTIFETSGSDVVVRESSSEGTTVDLKTKD